MVVQVRAAGRDAKQVCLETFERAEESSRTGKLIDAAVAFRACAAEPCSVAMRKECERGLHEVRDATPSLSIAVDDDESPATGARITVDDVEVPGAGEISVDPGGHRVRAREGSREASQQIMVARGERGKLVRLKLPPRPRVAEPAPPPPPPSRVPAWVPYAAVAVSAVGFVTFGYMGQRGRTRASDLRDECAPHCASSDVSAVRRDLLIADVGLLLGLGGAAAGYLTWPSASSSSAGPSRRIGVSFAGSF